MPITHIHYVCAFHMQHYGEQQSSVLLLRLQQAKGLCMCVLELVGGVIKSTELCCSP